MWSRYDEAIAHGGTYHYETRTYTILWVDDDPEVRNLAEQYIEVLGHTGDVAKPHCRKGKGKGKGYREYLKCWPNLFDSLI